jgi:putative protein-disulfide isomerase
MGHFNGKHKPQEERPELLYVYDALCGWCYGFSPVITQLFEHYNDRLDFLVLSGGMVKGESIGPVSQMAPYIKRAYKTVEQTCGVKFGEKYLNVTLESDDAILTSVPAARAMAAFRIEKPRMTVLFASRLQKAIFQDGMMCDDNESFGKIASEFELDATQFIAKMESDDITTIIENEFKMVKDMGINGFPTVLLRIGEKIEPIIRGYRDYNSIVQIIDTML